MILSPKTLFCHLPKDKFGYLPIMDLPELIYTDKHEALKDCLPEEKVVTLEVAFGRISANLINDH